MFDTSGSSDPLRQRLLKILAVAVGAYLVIGMAFAVLTMPNQSWSCTHPDRPGDDFGGGGEEFRAPKGWNCTPDVDLLDRVEWVGIGTVFGPVLFTLKAISERAAFCDQVPSASECLDG